MILLGKMMNPTTNVMKVHVAIFSCHLNNDGAFDYEDVDVGLHWVTVRLTVVHHFQHFFVDDAHTVNVVGIIME